MVVTGPRDYCIRFVSFVSVCRSLVGISTFLLPNVFVKGSFCRVLGLTCLIRTVCKYSMLLFIANIDIFAQFFFRDCRSFTSRKKAGIWQSVPVELLSSC